MFLLSVKHLNQIKDMHAIHQPFPKANYKINPTTAHQVCYNAITVLLTIIVIILVIERVASLLNIN